MKHDVVTPAEAPQGALLAISVPYTRDAVAALVEALIERIDADDGDPDLETTGAEDDFCDHDSYFAFGPGCPVSDPPERNGDEKDGNNAEDEVLIGYYGSGPGCEISDPGGGDPGDL